MYAVDGKVAFMRTLDLTLSPPWGPARDELPTCDVIVKISGNMSLAFGIELKSNDPQLAARMAMVQMLRDAYLHNKDVSVGTMEQPTDHNHNLKIARVQWGQQ